MAETKPSVERARPRSCVVLHVPHASTVVPPSLRDHIQLTDDALCLEVARMTDHQTDELFGASFPDANHVVFPVSRLVVDVERFEDDADETMSQVGMGVIYTHGSQRQRIREDPSPSQRRHLIETYYRPHHHRLTTAVESALHAHGRCLLIDGHSFPATPLPYEQHPDAARPDFCLGTHDQHTPPGLVQAMQQYLHGMGYTTALDEPFAGVLVPTRFYKKDLRVWAVMIEINRGLYLHDDARVNPEGQQRVIETLRGLRGVMNAWLQSSTS